MVPKQRPSDEIQAAKYLFFRNRKYDGEVAYAKRVLSRIATYEKEMLVGEYEKAEDLLEGLKKRVQSKVRKEGLKTDLMEEIEKRIKICGSIEQFTPYVEPTIRKRYEAQLADLIAQIGEYETALGALQSEYDATVKKMAQEASSHHEMLDDYQVQLNQKEEELKKLRKETKVNGRQIKQMQTQLSQQERELEEVRKMEMGNSAQGNFSDEIGAEEIEMVFIKGGSFQMGSPDDDPNAEVKEIPHHKVIISDFYLSKYPVTQALWRAVMGSSPEELRFKECDQCPVEGVSWNDAQEFLGKLNGKTGNIYRLPSEAEWEFAARGGLESKGYMYAGGSDLKSFCWFKDTSHGKTHPVGGLAPNELGLYDMSGNVYEWCQDKWYEDHSDAPNDGSFRETEQGADRVMRGGSWAASAPSCRASYRFSCYPDLRGGDVGFRLAHSI